VLPASQGNVQGSTAVTSAKISLLRHKFARNDMILFLLCTRFGRPSDMGSRPDRSNAVHTAQGARDFEPHRAATTVQ
jgi:hypothetical protein